MKNLEIKIGDRTAKLEVLEENENLKVIKVDNKVYELDVTKVEHGIYSFLHNGESLEFEVNRNYKNARSLHVEIRDLAYNLEIIDAQGKYLNNRKKDQASMSGNTISVPMPGKVVKLLVEVGDKVEAGDQGIVVSAMKMESVYKFSNSGTVSEINVKEGETVDANQVLIVIE